MISRILNITEIEFNSTKLDLVLTIIMWISFISLLIGFVFDIVNPFVVIALSFNFGYLIVRYFARDLEITELILYSFVLSEVLLVIVFSSALLLSIPLSISAIIILSLMIIYKLFTKNKLFTKKNSVKFRINLVYLLFVVLLIVIVTFPLLNVNMRAQKDHGFMHTVVIQSILKQGIPPQDPLFYGQIVTYPYLGHVLFAGLSDVSSLPISIIMAYHNIISIILIIGFMYLSIRIIQPKAGISNFFCIYISFFGIYAISRLLVLIGNFEFFDFRTLNFFHKFVLVNFNPLGLAYASVVLYALIQCCYNKAFVFTLIGGLVGVSFLYPIYTPLLSLLVVHILLIKLIYHKNKIKFILGFVRYVPIILLSAILIIIWAMHLVILRANSVGLVLGSPKDIALRANILLLLIPFVLFSFVFFAKLKKQPKTIYHFFLAGTLYPLIIYIFVNVGNISISYKFMFILYIVLSIPAGLGFDYFLNNFKFIWLKKTILVLIIVVFIIILIPTQKWNYNYQMYSGTKLKETTQGYQYILSQSANGRLFDWIKSNTSLSSIFLDSINLIPVFTDRGLFFAEGQIRGKKGRNRDEDYRIDFDYNYYIRILKYDLDDMEGAKTIKKNIMELERPSNTKVIVTSESRIMAVKYLRSLNVDIYAVFRKGVPPLHHELQEHFVKVFEVEDIIVYKLLK